MKKEPNSLIYVSVLVVFATLTLGTFLHDPVLHYSVARLFGWELADFSGNIENAFTNVNTVSPTPQQLWIFYMFPSIVIFGLVTIISVLYPTRLTNIAGVVLMSINLPSLLPMLGGSDSNKALEAMGGGVTIIIGHYLILLFAILLMGIVYYIGNENNERDMRSRAKNIWS